MNQVISLPNFGFLAVTGKDAVTFMQGYTTCDLDELTDTMSVNGSAIGAVCNLQGRMVTSFRCTRLPDGLLFRMDRSLVAETMAFLKKYIVFSKAEMADLSDELACFGVIGEAPALVDNAHLIQVSEDRFEIWGQTGMLEASGDSEDWWKQEIADGLAWVTPETKEEFIPQMFDYHSAGAIDFDKGCYLGQEIVARMQYRGNLNRRLHRGRANHSTEIGQPLLDEGAKRVGKIVAAAGNDFLAVVQAKGEKSPDCTLESGEAVEICPVQAITVE
jgi:folate-binding protein YgfZ